MFPPGLEPGTFRVLGERDNHYTTETLPKCPSDKYINCIELPVCSIENDCSKI